MTDNYDDIIDLPHHVSETRPRLSMEKRAAQFAPFAAITGHSEAIEDTIRTNDSIDEIDSDECWDDFQSI
ncbi:MAG: hypothetical protein IKI28_09865 [Bacteroidales bacterium]|nr:hypothetical protein [Bacteroidales bacterium]